MCPALGNREGKIRPCWLEGHLGTWERKGQLCLISINQSRCVITVIQLTAVVMVGTLEQPPSWTADALWARHPVGFHY